MSQKVKIHNAIQIFFFFAIFRFVKDWKTTVKNWKQKSLDCKVK